MSDETRPRKKEIDGLLDRMVQPETSDAAFEVLLSERANLIRAEVAEMGTPLDGDVKGALGYCSNFTDGEEW